MDRTALVLDTCNQWITIGLFGKNLELEKSALAPRKAFLYLHQWIAELLSKAKLEKPDWIVCTRGPGSFTGVRICVSTTRNLAQLWQIPALGVDTLGFMARQILETKKIQSDHIGVMIDGRQKKVYANSYLTLDIYDDVVQFNNIRDLSVEDFLRSTPDDCSYFLDQPEAIKKYIEDDFLVESVSWKSWSQPSARVLYDHAKRMGGYERADGWHKLLPLYIRPDPAHAGLIV